MSRFTANGSKLLEVHLANETVRALIGSMVAYEGDISFKKVGMGGGEGIKGAFKRKLTGESMTLMDCTGSGVVYIADEGKEVTLLHMQGETIFVEASNLLALDAGLRTGVQMTGMQGMSTGQGLFTTKVEGHGTVVFTSDGPAMAFEVGPQTPLCVDPQAYVAHSGQLQQDFIRDVNWRTMIGQGSGESFQMRFQGQGLVYVQPAERAALMG
jgi:uncharacterized protein (AIM24 family)